MAIPIEMRTLILADCNKGMTEVAAAEKWHVSQSAITKLKRHFRETGSLKPKKGKPGPKPKLKPHHKLIQKIVAKTPDATLEEIREQLPVKVCNETVAAALRKLKLAYKKKLSTPPNSCVPTLHKSERNGK
jgi:transposase